MTARSPHVICTVPGCDRPHESKGLCHSHAEYRRRTGKQPTGPIIKGESRFWTKVDKSDGCWLWKGATDGGGRYGALLWNGRKQQAHRVSLLIAGVDLPDGLDVDHLCRVTLCVRPDHLEVVTHLTNMQRGANATRTHCPHGHPYEGDNLYINPGSGGRVCRTCMRAGQAERMRKWRAEQKAKRTA